MNMISKPSTNYNLNFRFPFRINNCIIIVPPPGSRNSIRRGGVGTIAAGDFDWKEAANGIWAKFEHQNAYTSKEIQ